MKTKKQKLPSKKFLKSESLDKHQKFIDEVIDRLSRKKHVKTAIERFSEKAIEIASRNGKKRIKAARKPAHTGVFEGYGVMLNDPKGQKLLHGKGRNPFFTQKEIEARVLAAEWRKHLKPPVEVVKLRAEFKVI